MNWRALAVLLGLIAALTVVGTGMMYYRPALDTVTVPLGIALVPDPAALVVDNAIIEASTSHIDGELRTRLAKPTLRIEVQGFFMDRCEVSQREYEQFAEFKLVGEPPLDKEDSLLWSRSTGHRIAGRLDSAASGIRFVAAESYCDNSGGRLPYAYELEVAASGTTGRIYPWGNDFTEDPWPFQDPDRNSAQRCDAHPAASTPNGIQALASNVMEWGLGMGEFGPESDQVSVHGAPPVRSKHRSLYAMNANWLGVDRDIVSHHVGFRCVYDSLPTVPIWSRTPLDVAYVPSGFYELGLPSTAQLPNFVANLDNIRDLDLERLVSDSERPSELEVSECEITRGEYQQFLRDPFVQLGFFGNPQQPKGTDYEPLEWERQLEDLNLPVSGIDWWSADAYARWAGGRLPSASEWQSVATGPDADVYPWGTTFETGLDEDNVFQVTPCGENDADATLSGVFDLGGNLSEWTNTLSASHGKLQMWVQGGNWRMHTAKTTQTMFGRTVPLNHKSENIGIRVVFGKLNSGMPSLAGLLQ